MTINLFYVLIKLRALQEQALVLARGSYGGPLSFSNHKGEHLWHLNLDQSP
jgi:hypothetical protein